MRLVLPKKTAENRAKKNWFFGGWQNWWIELRQQWMQGRSAPSPDDRKLLAVVWWQRRRFRLLASSLNSGIAAKYCTILPCKSSGSYPMFTRNTNTSL